jgi:S1-C subfamily serine protease
MPDYAQPPYGQPAQGTSQTSQVPLSDPAHGAQPFGQPPFGEPPSGYPPYGEPTGDSPPPPARRRRVRSLLTYVTVAALAAGAGAGVTAYALNNGSKPANSASPPLGNGNGGSFPNIGIPGFNPGSSGPGSPGQPVRSAADRAAVNAVRPGLVDISSNLGYQGSQAAATGMIISPNGYVLTNNHVITDTTQLFATVFTTHQRYKAQWLGYDASDDVAVIKLIGAHNLRTVPLGHSNTVKLGDKVIAIGNAYGQSVAQAVVGSITGLNRTITASDSGAATSETLHGMFQTNAGIVQGDSGGPLVSASGQVIGMDTAASTGGLGESIQNIGFAIPIDRALQIAREIMNNEPSSKIQIGSNGFLGVLVPAAAASQATDPAQQRQLQQQQDQQGSGFPVQPSGPACMANDLNAGVPTHIAPVDSGALVIGELCGTPADKAGIIAGDVITVVAGHSVTSPVQLTNIMGGLRPGTSVQVTWVDVSGHRHTGTLVLVQAPPH